MSRQLDLSKPLSDDDRQYAEDRGLLAPISPEATGLTGNEPSRNSDHHTPVGVGLASLTANPSAQSVVEAESAGLSQAPTSAVDARDYEKFSVSQLQQELENRELSKSGSKAELVSRLQNDDKEGE